ncbi:alkene reductase [Denitratimonas tolerans]|uniref:Alkene reductase n=1 Tax=Denitratimonas tolerans TaxID=1338420 RepID=A0AAW9R2J8_9GAMM
MTTLFDPLPMGALHLPNRIVMAPLTRSRSRGGIPGPHTATYYVQRASAGLIISEGVAISPQAQGYANVPGLYTPAQRHAWREVTEAVHAAGGRIVAQLWHVGRISHVALQPGGAAPVAPSALMARTNTYLIDPRGGGDFVPVSAPRALEASEIPGVVDDFARAATAAREAGFDGVEIHGANGYLIDQFLRAGSNHRDDAWGGSIGNRVRFLDAVAAAVVRAIGADRTGVRLSPVTAANDANDTHPQPLFEAAVRALAVHDLAFVHVIEGATGAARDFQQGETPFDYDALRRTWREAGGRGAWILNNGYDGELAAAAVASGRADAVAFGRAFIANPDLVRRLREGAPLNLPDRTTFYGGDERGYTDYPGLA